ncbi:MAG: sigma-54 dependent transcriptional regulator, partial [Porticoccaceae bacterium]|nr:sigma-54 dependent transcriptional regulator [Porticoccaceae bacterium]
MVTDKVLNTQHNLLLLAEEATFGVVDEIIALLPSWYCHTVYNWEAIPEPNYDKTIHKPESKEQPGLVTRATSTLHQEPLSVGLFALGSNPDNNTLERLERVLKTTRAISWVAVLSDEHFNNRKLMALVVTYCQDYISCPLNDLKNKLSGMLGHIAGMTQLRIAQQKELSNHPMHGASNGQYNMIGASPVMQKVFQLIPKYAKTDAPVVISGESGTGKELVAQAIHQQSERADKPFVAVNCGAIPENLLESELFGHIKGAFTGATQDRDGRITVANGGTLFLDEIGDLSLHQQVKILRFLQEGTFEPVGSSQTQQVDVRIITASHIDLQQAIEAQEFREDLYYRLNVLQLTVPALRMRGADIELLAHYYLAEFTAGRTTSPKGFTPEA